MEPDPCYIAFVGSRRLASGSPADVARAARQHLDQADGERIAVFDDATGAPVDLDLRGTPDEVAARIAAESEPAPERRAGPGRPKLGVVSREVSLLPRHWEWLANESGGASAALRRLVEAARRQGEGAERARRARDAAHKFLWAMAGDLPAFEEASRAFYARDLPRFQALTEAWPPDVREQALRMVTRWADLLEAPDAP